VIPDVSDADLATRACRGESAALAMLYQRHGDAVIGIAYRLMGSVQDAEDVLHDVFLGLPEALLRYQERGSLGAWIRRLAVHTALDRMRRGRRRREVSLDRLHPPQAAGSADAILAAATLQDAIAKLSDALRTVFVLKEIEGYSHGEIGSLLGISVSASEARLSRAVKALARQLRSSR
jgi:RNA polymerase sigma-70 factor (ECF subfamily)